jgi:NTE family protein
MRHDTVLGIDSGSMAHTTTSIDLALQGGASHGAFTWGVLDALLEDGSLEFAGISGTSAGALNGAVLVTGLARAGRDAAREALHDFWRDVASAGSCFDPFSGQGGGGPLWDAWTAPMAQAWAHWTRAFSPYQLNPFGLNPLKNVLERHVDVDALRSAIGPRLFTVATAVRTGRPRVFSGDALSLDALLASACLPYMFKAVEIDGEPYWDGGYSGNPAVWPLIYETTEADVLLVKIQPLERPDTPRTAFDIAERAAEISFNTALIGELRAIAFVKRLLEEERIERGRYKDLRMHMIADEEELARLPAKSKLDTNWDFLQQLRGMGRAAAQDWLARNRQHVGVRSSIDIGREFLGIG